MRLIKPRFMTNLLLIFCLSAPFVATHADEESGDMPAADARTGAELEKQIAVPPPGSDAPQELCIFLHKRGVANMRLGLCNCDECRALGRYVGVVHRRVHIFDCHFMPWFLEKLEKLDMQWELSVTWVDCQHIDETDGSPLDVHFANSSGCWDSVLYGAKLTRATFINDPELRKLSALFDTLLG